MAAPTVPQQTQANDRGEDAERPMESISPWLLVWTILVAKLGTLGIIVWAARSAESGALIAVTSLPWFVLGVVLAAGPFLFRYRLRRVRSRREELRRQEWMMPASAVSRETKSAIRTPRRKSGNAEPPVAAGGSAGVVGVDR